MSIKDSFLQYLQELKKSESRKQVHVKEIGVTIYFTPVTVCEQEKIFSLSGGGAQSKQFHLATVIEKAENEDGSKIFDIQDKPFLEQLPWRVITRISNAIQGDYSVEKAKKTPSRPLPPNDLRLGRSKKLLSLRSQGRDNRRAH